MSARTYTEEEVQDLTDRVFLLKEKLEAGNIKVASHLADDFLSSLQAIRLRPDGKVNPYTVDGRIRAMTLAVMAMKQREEAKKRGSLIEIQEAYFKFLFMQFGWLYDQMIKAKTNPYAVGQVLSRDDDFVKDLTGNLPTLVEAISEYWRAAAETAGYHLQDTYCLKATFAGDLFPAHWENPVSMAGLYVDTIILPCPIMRIAPIIKFTEPRQVAALFVKHVLNAMTYRELATTDVAPPIVLVVPNHDDFEGDQRANLVERYEPATLKHAQYLFGRNFESNSDLFEFCSTLKTIEGAVKELKNPDRLVFDTEWGKQPEAQLAEALKQNIHSLPNMEPDNAGHRIFQACVGRMPQAAGAQETATHFGGTPLISAETSWLYYTWFLEYQGAEATGNDAQRQSLHVVRALTSEADNNLEWLGRVPTKTIIELRKNGLAEEVRALLGEGIPKLIGLNPNNYFRTADQVVDNLERAFREHQKAIKEAKLKKLKLYGIDVAGCIASGGLAVAAALTGNVGLGVASGLAGAAGFSNLKDISTKFKAIAEEDRVRKMSPTGLLFRHVERK